MNFGDAFTRLINPQHEGAFSNNPKDPGNWTGGKVGVGVLKGTKYGISAKSYPDLDIENLTPDLCKPIYYRDFWCKAGCEAVPDPVKFELFDTAVNAGVDAAIKMLQNALGVRPDGDLGPITLGSIPSFDPWQLLARFDGWRLDYLNDLSTWPTFSRGWTQRIAQNLKAA